MPRANQHIDPEDYFADTRMSFGDHIEELRTHLIRAITGFVIGMLVALIFSSYVFHFITKPVENQLNAFYERRVAREAKRLEEEDPKSLAVDRAKEVPVEMRVGEFRSILEKMGLQAQPRGQVLSDDEWIEMPFRIRPLKWEIALAEAQRIVTRPATLSTLSVMEGMMAWVKIAMATGLVISSPWVFWQIWAFIAAGLYPHEKKYVHKYLPISLFLFLIGVLVCQFMVIPKAIQGLLWFNEWLGLEPDLRFNEWLSFALLLPIVFGLAFQTPMVMLFLAKLGILDADSFRAKRRMAWFIMAIFSAVFTPVDAISMMLMWIPMVGLYELGILMVQYSAKHAADEESLSEADELVEV
jgi:sec-independent protein translocase protein TatC